MTKKQIILRGLGATLVLGVIGVFVNGATFLAQDKRAEQVAYVLEEAEDLQESAPSEENTVGGDETTKIRPGQMTAPDFVRELMKRRVREMSRSEAIKRADELGAKREREPLSEEEQEELDFILERHFPPAAREAPPEPIMVEEDKGVLSGQLDVNDVFNKVWGLFQGIILAWVGYKLNDKRKKD